MRYGLVYVLLQVILTGGLCAWGLFGDSSLQVRQFVHKKESSFQPVTISLQAHLLEHGSGCIIMGRVTTGPKVSILKGSPTLVKFGGDF